MTGKTVPITGASAGIGKATASELAARGARVAMPRRAPGRARAPRLGARVRGRRARALPADRRAGEHAGVFRPVLRTTADGFEEQIGVNHLGHFLLTNLLLERLAASAPARVVHVGSMMHGGGRIDFASFRARDAAWWMRVGMRLVGTSPAKGARTSVQLASAPELEGVTGKYFVSGREKAPDPAALDAGLARALWDESAKLVGLA